SDKETIRKEMEDLHLADASIKQLEEEETLRRMHDIERDCLKSLVKEGLISEEILQKYQAEQDVKVAEQQDESMLPEEIEQQGQDGSGLEKEAPVTVLETKEAGAS
ncbi:MAG TPA: hypothetical protein PK671_23620, partial [Candidatus Obscuribacter sp.]|nr:hypothetical protein [Candidatus Obscuribacter sp.]